MEEYQPGAVHSTTDYSKFKYLEANRLVNKSHVNAIIRSMEKRPELIQTRPILVNEKGDVIDGQHRLQACMTLGLPIHFTVAPNTSIEDAQLMNALQKGWNLIDYARSYAKNGRINYQKFLELREEYNVPPSLLIHFMLKHTGKHDGANFRHGIFEIRDISDIRADLDRYEDFSAFVPFWKDITFGNTVLTLLRKTSGYDHKQMMRKLELRKPQRQGTTREYLRELEDIYNWKQSEETRLRFYS